MRADILSREQIDRSRLTVTYIRIDYEQAAELSPFSSCVCLVFLITRNPEDPQRVLAVN